MKLPKLDLPLFETKLPSDDTPIKYRPFTVKEEKILLVAQESKDSNQMVLAMKQIIRNCCVDVVPESLPMFDLEYLMLQVRSKSVNNNIVFTVTDQETEKNIELELDIDDITLHVEENHTKKIDIDENIYLMMRYPTIEEVAVFLNFATKNIENAEDGVEDLTATLFNVMISCIDCIVNGDEVQKMSDFEPEEVMTFIESAPGGTIDALRDCFDTVPTLRYEVKYVNANGNEKKVVLEGTETFFL